MSGVFGFQLKNDQFLGQHEYRVACAQTDCDITRLLQLQSNETNRDCVSEGGGLKASDEESIGRKARDNLHGLSPEKAITLQLEANPYLCWK